MKISMTFLIFAVGFVDPFTTPHPPTFAEHCNSIDRAPPVLITSSESSTSRIRSTAFQLYSSFPRELPLGDIRVESADRIRDFIESIDLNTRRQVIEIIASRRRNQQLIDLAHSHSLFGKFLWYFRYIVSTRYIAKSVFGILRAFASNDELYNGQPVPATASGILDHLIRQYPNLNYLTPEDIMESYRLLTTIRDWKLYEVEMRDIASNFSQLTFNWNDWIAHSIISRKERIWFRGTDLKFSLVAEAHSKPRSPTDDMERFFSFYQSVKYLSYFAPHPVLALRRDIILGGEYRPVASIFWLPIIMSRAALKEGVVSEESNSARIREFVEDIPVEIRSSIIRRFMKVQNLPNIFEMIENISDPRDKWYARYLMSFLFISPEMHDLIIEIKRDSRLAFLPGPPTAAAVVEYYTAKYPNSIYITPEHVQWWFTQVEGGAFYKQENVSVLPDEPFYILDPSRHSRFFENRLKSLLLTGFEIGIIPFFISDSLHYDM